jgi:two-component system, cell cycle sensor histidine kinase and response regulator CckA
MNASAQTTGPSKPSVLERALRILHLEDNPDDRRVVQQWLTEQKIATDFTDVDNEADFVKALEQKTFDIVLSDKSLPGFDGLAALRFVREKFPHVPFVFVTGSMGEEAAIDTIKDGATDYVLKDRLSRLIPAVQRAIREADQEEKNRQIEEKNRQQAALLDKAQDAILVTDVEDRVLYWNKSAERIYGWPASETIGRNATELLSTDPVRYEEAKQLLLEKGNWTGELIAANRGGNELIIEGRWTLVRDELGRPKSILIIDTDITEKKSLEAKFLRSQRMDSIGALAGGIAHDLNNALAPVIMSAELLKTSLDEAGREKFLDIIYSNAHRATDLVKQILSFARGSGGQSGPVKLNHLIGEMTKMIQDTFPKSMVFSVNTSGKELWTVHGDTTELHQVLLNLCVNARDAMPHGGRLILSAQNTMLEGAAAAAIGATPGPYVMIAVADTGSGIPPEVLPRIFEPFFTTKKGDKGTGLGLSTVAEIVKHHGGFIDLKTETGKGTEFKIHLPAISTAEKEEVEPEEVVLPTGGGELILVIDDEETVRELTKTTLESYGYRVVTAQNGLQGIARFRENPHEIRLLVTDTDMPHMDGMGAITAIKELKPDLPIIIVSGSKRETADLQPNDSVQLKSLEKPYSLDQLLMAVALGLQN